MYAAADFPDSAAVLLNTRPFSAGLAARASLLQHEAAQVSFRQAG
jgi:hypothetical protein